MCVQKAIAALMISFSAGLASASAETDIVSRARMAAIEGDHATCAKLAGEAREQHGADGRVHHLYATCQTFNADARRSELSEADYAAELEKAIAAYEFLLQTPGLLPHLEERASVEFIVEELRARVDRSSKNKEAAP